MIFSQQELADLRLKLPGFFFECMKKGWASGARPTYGVLEGEKRYEFWDSARQLCLRDTYFTNPYTRISHGVKLIIYREMPVWIMHYGGQYEEVAIPLLKEALMSAYEANEFYGGRGPAHFYNNKLYTGFLYVNHIEVQDEFYPGLPGQKSNFENFRGKEDIQNAFGKILGRHCYNGESLIKKTA